MKGKNGKGKKEGQNKKNSVRALQRGRSRKKRKAEEVTEKSQEAGRRKK